jgi:hypothetical protein
MLPLFLQLPKTSALKAVRRLYPPGSASPILARTKRLLIARLKLRAPSLVNCCSIIPWPLPLPVQNILTALGPPRHTSTRRCHIRLITRRAPELVAWLGRAMRTLRRSPGGAMVCKSPPSSYSISSLGNPLFSARSVYCQHFPVRNATTPLPVG